MTLPRFVLLALHFASCVLSFKTIPVRLSCSKFGWELHAMAVSVGFHLTWSKALPLTRTAQAVRASLLASAATTTLYGRRSNSPRSSRFAGFWL